MKRLTTNEEAINKAIELANKIEGTIFYAGCSNEDRMVVYVDKYIEKENKDISLLVHLRTEEIEYLTPNVYTFEEVFPDLV